MSEALMDFEKRLFGGNEPGKIVLAKTDDEGWRPTMYLMDAEYDPMRITFDSDGHVTLHAEEYTHLMLSKDQLEYIAEVTDYAAEMAYRAVNDEDEVRPGYKRYIAAQHKTEQNKNET